MNFKAVLFCFLFLSVSFSSHSQEVRIKLENCTVEKETIDRIQHALNFQLSFYQVTFNDPTTSKFKARIFATEKEYVRYAKEEDGYNPLKHNALAFYSPTLKEMILHKETKGLATVFAHELNHALLDEYCPDASAWLNEGLSELLEDIVYLDSTYYFGADQAEKIQNVKFLFMSGESVRSAITAKDFYVRLENYSLSFAVVFYLYKANREVLNRILRGGGNDDVDLSGIYPGGLDLLVTDVKSYFLNEDFN